MAGSRRKDRAGNKKSAVPCRAVPEEDFLRNRRGERNHGLNVSIFCFVKRAVTLSAGENPAEGTRHAVRKEGLLQHQRFCSRFRFWKGKWAKCNSGLLIARIIMDQSVSAMMKKITNEKEYEKALRQIAYLVNLDQDSSDPEELNELVLAVKMYNNQTYKVYRANSYYPDRPR
jgi:hypothetical protein